MVVQLILMHLLYCLHLLTSYFLLLASYFFSHLYDPIVLSLKCVCAVSEM